MSFIRMLIAAASTATIFACTTSPELAAAAEPIPMDSEVAQVAARSVEANAALMRGDVLRYRSLMTLTDDFTLMSPFGGAPTRAPTSDAHWERIGGLFRNGSFDQQVIQSYATPDMIVLATIERSTVEVGGLPAQEWPLRVTLVYRKVGTGWQLAHRHADPLAPGISLERAAALARGE